jgi:hypothetical protein
MKSLILSLLVTTLLLVSACADASPLVFGVKPNLSVQSAYLGYEKGRMMPYFGLDLFGIGVDYESEDVDWTQSGYPPGPLYRESVDRTERDGSALLLIPRLGIRYDFQSTVLKPYLFADLFRCFASVDVSGKDTHQQYAPDGSLEYEEVDPLDSGDEEAVIKDLLGVWGFNLGFGTEYMVSEQFGVSGEYALRLYHTSAEDSNTDSSDWNEDGQDDWRSDWSEELSGTLHLTYAAVSLNYHF